MNLNESSLRHPRTQWAIEAAMWRAIEYGAAIASSAAGKEIVTVVHDRSQVPALTFWKGCEDISDKFRAFLRSNR